MNHPTLDGLYAIQGEEPLSNGQPDYLYQVTSGRRMVRALGYDWQANAKELLKRASMRTNVPAVESTE